MNSRLELQEIFEKLLNSRNVYYQPPKSILMSYPAIVYKRVRINTTNADDLKYLHKPLYEVTLIDKNPESEFVYKILELPYCSDANEFITDNLYHHVFNLYF